ncbi:MAG: hypothetical protein U9P90_04445 [Patescibacteria group bacterium]|nr:hypothetical protein [Patescibacteria group bacterium]
MKKTLFSLLMLSLFALPLCPLGAEITLTRNTLIKGSFSSVYYYGGDEKRYVFPNEKTYFTWYNDFSKVITISDNQLGDIPIGGNITYKPGVKMIKITSSPKVYAVSKGGKLKWIQTEEVARNLYGENWNELIDDVSDAFFVNYIEDGIIFDSSEYNRSTEMSIENIGNDKGIAIATTASIGTTTYPTTTTSPGTTSYPTTTTSPETTSCDEEGSAESSTDTTSDDTDSATDSDMPGSDTFEKSVFFVHHSTGEIYWDNGMSESLETHGYSGVAPWWDGGTDPQDFYNEFTVNWGLLAPYGIIIFKSCFPASDITSDSMLEDYKTWYRQLYSIYESHPDKLFVPMSTPPLLETNTSFNAAQRSLEFENWLMEEYTNEYSRNNLAPFRLHSLLSDTDGYLHSSYISSPGDNHPNNSSGPIVGDAVWQHLDEILSSTTIAMIDDTTNGTTSSDTAPETDDSGDDADTATIVYETSDTSTELIQPTDLVYKGAFRLPNEDIDTDWRWGGEAMAYYPDGDPSGPNDGFPGSIFGVGHDWYKYVSEISIPIPVISPTKNLADLNTAETLQNFSDVKGGMFGGLEEIIRVGMEYLPAQGSQTTGKLYFSWGDHFQNYPRTHMWSELDLSIPNPQGEWVINDGINSYNSNDYIFSIPESWAISNTPNQFLVTGRFRDGGWSGQGPSMFAIGPWNDGNPPPNGTNLSSTPLLLYSSSDWSWNPEGNDYKMTNYHHSDEWMGGAWLEKNDKSAVIFAGTKGIGDCWYGFSNDVVWSDETPYPEVPPDGDRGWWSNEFVGQIIFYNPNDLAAVARGEMEPHEPQPYATLDIDSFLYNITHSQQKYHVRAMSTDRARGLIYIFEHLVDEEKPIVHVWEIQ